MSTLVWEANGRLTHFDLHEGTDVIAGRRAPEAAIVVPHQTVSRTHARIVMSGGICWIEHLSSTNATTVNGRAVTGAVRLADGDVLVLGTQVISYHDPVAVKIPGRVACPHCKRPNPLEQKDCWFCGENLVNATLSAASTGRAACVLVKADGSRHTVLAGEEGRIPGAVIDGSASPPVLLPSGPVQVDGAPADGQVVLVHGRVITVGADYLVVANG